MRTCDVDEAANKKGIPDIVDTGRVRCERAVGEGKVEEAAMLHGSDVAANQIGSLYGGDPVVPGCAFERVKGSCGQKQL